MSIEGDFWSLENAAGHGAHIDELTKVGEKDIGNRRYIFYRDQEDRGWYRVIVKKDGNWMSEYESIFGKKEKAGRASPRP